MPIRRDCEGTKVLEAAHERGGRSLKDKLVHQTECCTSRDIMYFKNMKWELKKEGTINVQ